MPLNATVLTWVPKAVATTPPNCDVHEVAPEEDQVTVILVPYGAEVMGVVGADVKPTTAVTVGGSTLTETVVGALCTPALLVQK